MAEDTSSRPAPEQMHPLLTFTLKTVIVVAAATISLAVLMDNLIRDVGDFIDRRVRQTAFSLQETGLTNIGGRAFWERLERALDKAADPTNDVPPEHQQKLLRDVRVLADRARPFILEAGKAFTPLPARTDVQDK
jgi:hypothetical protein